MLHFFGAMPPTSMFSSTLVEAEDFDVDATYRLRSPLWQLNGIVINALASRLSFQTSSSFIFFIGEHRLGERLTG
ncbi:hypothetical protein [Klebsiella pneumoniae]|uniref:hypothetical protein n=1 Tax=Klebsiella pneumoniae TaxID=573 RepID=UPI003C130030